MKITLDNGQHTPHIDIMDSKGKIVRRLDICFDGFLLDSKEVPEKDGIIIWEDN